MNALTSFLSAHTCGEACWSAHDDECHCSCGGKNHGCLREENGTRPTRTAKIMGRMHTLTAVGTQDELHDAAYKYNLAAGVTFVFADSAREGYMAGPAKIRKATEAQIAKWPELATMRNWAEGHERWDAWKYAPYLLWIANENPFGD